MLNTATGPDLQQSIHFDLTILKLPLKSPSFIVFFMASEKDFASFFLQSFPLQTK
ncbi:hypothetical protein ADICYQ_0913 [Cyclobacterium qasimii M12-11B]|uniref:Uncharacterized protein n=1 Tax=Cyclobacterium qasimii M12-11B TaxID=641524 RepID=S7WUR8_9BACT|nr:hypothetical protein ADICYQ_0913 [Cyclobacterium qasimii M12-11B]